MAVQPKPARSSAPGRRPTPLGHRPRRPGAGERTNQTYRRDRTQLSTAPTPAHEPSRGDDTGQLLSVFLGATLLMVVAVIVVGVVNLWWVLVPVMLVDFAATFGVVAYIARLLADDGESSPSRRGLTPPALR